MEEQDPAKPIKVTKSEEGFVLDASKMKDDDLSDHVKTERMC